jgi:UDP-N-acetylmuramoyl-tripeptide--D-alanyl-D-alanine ligase
MQARVIAITGTNGKTTTKELLAATLSTHGATLYTEGNLNNAIGVPLTLLRLRPEHRWAVVEMGANHGGEIAALCRMAEPDAGLITNVGQAHLEGFGSFEGVVRAKAELYDYLRATGGTAFVSCDQPVLRALSASLPAVVTYGASEGAAVQGRVAAASPTLSVEWKGSVVATQLAGSYNFDNVMAAICVAQYFGAAEEEIRQAIASYMPANHRSQRLDTGRNRLIIDAYNANPDSMQAALSSFRVLNDRPKMLVLGEMRELGAYTEQAHQRLVDSIPPDVEAVWLVGAAYSACASLPAAWKCFPDTEHLVDYVQAHPVAGFSILIKGSRSNRLEWVIPYL